MKKIILLGLVALSSLARADMELPVQEQFWKKQFFVEGGGPRSDETARLAIEAGQAHGVKSGSVLSIGPWRSGDYSLRHDWHQSIPLKDPMTLRFSYRTEHLQAGQAEIVVQWMKNGQRLRRDTFPLPDAGRWTPFAIALRRVPPGSDALIPGVGLGSKTRVGRALFASLKLTDGVAPLAFPDDPGAITRPAPPAVFEQPAFAPLEPQIDVQPGVEATNEPPKPPAPRFRLQKAKDVWWLVTPENKAFFSLGTDAPSFDKEDLKAGRDSEAKLRALVFNSLAGRTDLEHWSALNNQLQAEGKTPLATFAALQSSKLEGDFDVLQSAVQSTRGEAKKAEHAFPDPFDPRFETAYRTEAFKVAELVKNKPWFVGYFADNEVAHRDLATRLWSPHCARAFGEWLEDKYETIAKANAAWGTKFASFDDFLGKKPTPSAERMSDDFHLFSREVVKQYVLLTVEAWRDADPDHLVFSNRLMASEANEVLPYLDLYGFYDGIGVNLYPANEAPGLSEGEKQRLQMIHQITRKPLIISEWSVPARDSRLYENGDKLDGSWLQTVDSQEQRGRQTAKLATDFYNLPFVIGAHWFTWRDFDSQARQANRGLHKTSGEPWREVVEALTKSNARLNQHFSAALR